MLRSSGLGQAKRGELRSDELCDDFPDPASSEDNVAVVEDGCLAGGTGFLRGAEFYEYFSFSLKD